MIFTGTTNKTQKFHLYYAHIPTHQLTCTLTRDQNWYKQRPHWIQMLNKITHEIKTQGLQHPLSVLYHNNQLQIHCGGQRYTACKKLNHKTIPCIIAYKLQDTHKAPPTHQQITTLKQLHQLHHNQIQQIHLANNCFEILTKNRHNYDPNNLLPKQ